MGKASGITFMFVVGWTLTILGYFAYQESWQLFDVYGRGLWGISCGMAAMIAGSSLLLSAAVILVLSMLDYIRSRH
jgi:hypothetical protein